MKFWQLLTSKTDNFLFRFLQFFGFEGELTEESKSYYSGVKVHGVLQNTESQPLVLSSQCPGPCSNSADGPSPHPIPNQSALL